MRISRSLNSRHFAKRLVFETAAPGPDGFQSESELNDSRADVGGAGKGAFDEIQNVASCRNESLFRFGWPGLGTRDASRSPRLRSSPWRTATAPQLADVVKKLGLEIHTSSEPITPKVLAGARILYLRAPSMPFTAAETDAIVAFVK